MIRSNKIHENLYIKNFAIIELVLIFCYLFIILFSIVIFPINIILGIICILFLPGYNLLNLIKPEINLIQKLGYTTIISLAIDNVIMFFYYVFLYDIFTTPSNPGFFFSEFTIIIIQFFNIIVILISLFKSLKSQTTSNLIFKYHKDKKGERDKIKGIDFLGLIFFIIFLISLFSLCFSTIFGYIKQNDFYYNYQIYQSNFTFFRRVPFVFYIFLFNSILCLIYIIFFMENTYLKIGSISIFLYCLWILPFFQIGYYFDADSYLLSTAVRNYLRYGIRADSGNSFLVMIGGPSIFRYSTSVFTTILLLMGTNTSLNFVLWYIYPLIYLFLPFFLYSIFQKYSNKKDCNNLDLIILVIIAILTPLTIKNEHTAETGVIGLLIFFILVIEFFELMKFSSINTYKKRLIFIIFLYFFLCLTHLEECIYFLNIIIFYAFYFLLTNNYRMINYKPHYKKFYINSYNKQKILPFVQYQSITKNNLKKFFFIIIFLIFILTLIFYFSQEFFGYIPYYLDSLSKNNNFIKILSTLYRDTKVRFLPLLKGSLSISLFLLFTIIIGIFILSVIFYLIIFKFHTFFIKKYKAVLYYVKKGYKIIKNHLLSKKLFQVLLFPIFFIIIIFLDFFYPFLEGQGFLVIVELILSYSILIFHIFLFINGTLYYEPNDNKKNYFLLSIISSTSMMLLLYITGNILFAFYILNVRFFSYLTFFNLIIIQNNYFKKFINMKHKYLFIMVFLLLFLGVFMSLRRLAYG